jgi:hypothetical protein
MAENQLTEKQELQMTKDQMEKDIVALDQNGSKVRQYWKVNSFFLIFFVSFAFFYPLLYNHNFMVLVYLAAWVSVALAVVNQLKLLLRMIEGEIKKTSMVILVKAIEDELENIRVKEYDELRRKVEGGGNGQDLQGSEQTT